MKNDVVIIGIAGPSGSGKSLLASTIVNELGSSKVVVISEDSYYKDLGDMPLKVRSELNYDHPDSLDHDLLIKHLEILQSGREVAIPQYDHSAHARLPDTRLIQNHTIIVLEGILLFVDPALRKLMDMRIFVDTPLDICFIRRLERDIIERQRSVHSIIKQYSETVRPMYQQFIEPSKRHADIIVPRGGKNRIAIDIIKAKLNELLI
ncbi:MAG: uridine kinase [Gammaproteobacteria bacterium]|nr:uridine kinase [Gammaproteobacteria bacterium]